MSDAEKMARFETASGFLAALDQSGGSTPNALELYGIDLSAYSSEAEMFALINAERSRIVQSPAFDGTRILAAILFEATLDYRLEGLRFADYLWKRKGIIPFLKIDQGLQEQRNGVQLMRDIDGLDSLLESGAEAGVLGTKARSVIRAADPRGVDQVVAQQFELANRVLDAGLLPIIEPEVSLSTPDRALAEELLKGAIVERLADIGQRKIAVKITIPAIDGFYAQLIEHPKVARVLALSGGYDRAEANRRLARNPGLIASFSRALLQGLSIQQSDADFDQSLEESIASIYAASIT